MYIGPWQEYRLSRVSGGLESALRNLGNIKHFY